MSAKRHYEILSTVDRFMQVVPFGRHRAMVIHWRRHGGREYLRLRTWNLHRKLGVWYPSRRGFVVPLAFARDLSHAIHKAADGIIGPHPAWVRDADDALEAVDMVEVGHEHPDDAIAPRDGCEHCRSQRDCEELPPLVQGLLQADAQGRLSDLFDRLTFEVRREKRLARLERRLGRLAECGDELLCDLPPGNG